MKGTYYPKPIGPNSSDRIIERKQLSLKSTVKRIALGAVDSLSFGVVGVITSSAATTSVNGITDDRIWINISVHGLTQSKVGIRSLPLVSHFIMFPKGLKTLGKDLKFFRCRFESDRGHRL